MAPEGEERRGALLDRRGSAGTRRRRLLDRLAPRRSPRIVPRGSLGAATMRVRAFFERRDSFPSSAGPHSMDRRPGPIRHEASTSRPAPRPAHAASGARHRRERGRDGRRRRRPGLPARHGGGGGRDAWPWRPALRGPLRGGRWMPRRPRGGASRAAYGAAEATPSGAARRPPRGRRREPRAGRVAGGPGLFATASAPRHAPGACSARRIPLRPCPGTPAAGPTVCKVPLGPPDREAVGAAVQAVEPQTEATQVARSRLVSGRALPGAESQAFSVAAGPGGSFIR